MIMPKCKCGHAELEHASDETHKDTQPCWAGAVVGEHCDCKNYTPALSPALQAVVDRCKT